MREIMHSGKNTLPRREEVSLSGEILKEKAE